MDKFKQGIFWDDLYDVPRLKDKVVAVVHTIAKAAKKVLAKVRKVVQLVFDWEATVFIPTPPPPVSTADTCGVRSCNNEKDTEYNGIPLSLCSYCMHRLQNLEKIFNF